MKDLSVIIVSYNTKNITQKSLDSVIKSLSQTPKVKAEIIIVDNASTDGSTELLQRYLHKYSDFISIINNSKNVGFSKANNEAIEVSQGKYILFLNSDAILQDVNFEDLIYYLDKNDSVGALTIKVLLPTGKIDWASHRGTPNIWRSLTYFSKLELLFSHVPKLAKYFGGYHLKHLDLNTIHEIDSPSGAFYFTRKEILNKTGGFDTRFFMYGEDLDLSYRIKKLGYKIIYYPMFTVCHLKYRSGLKRGLTSTEKQTKNYFYEAMKEFYNKHSAPHHPRFISKLVHLLINLKKRF
ncbi:hypothetical protein A3C23_05955 [Candidatus Roizmanbacteria bacterium RIFCSPHIGHO2_02_FULL_37_13b]|uniref:Glycosyltransferase 2-like domain-containing protein n=1 Tax=Candidatus Roizmanbacteria bacterium RIFCSPLOWO2_02_FULL_36_11 TaxID=1802071 RepID=A0A1F7JCQ0_9BACT|nr:MAG: hypothetical protein A3C23_05955 [Candidatus Roizmanbacteria bacterium RIFCSPHIGHO2_02_FULL_37_13b]OGK53390.1 MAG: hypothetical protein A3H78_02495 [Candidatus Roizmanbacteria bacterium RIFCSPLOWO2_02_FULL_36_11]